MSKKLQAIEIYKANLGDTREQIIAKFMSQLDMTPAGAATYFASTRKLVTKPATAISPFSKPTSSHAEIGVQHKETSDNRTLHHVSYYKDGKVCNTSSHYDLASAEQEHAANSGTTLSSGKLPVIELE